MVIARRFGVLALGCVLLVVGVALVAATIVTEPSASFGWTAYAPLSDVTYRVGPLLDPAGLAGIVLVLAGLALVAGWIGFRLGRRPIP